MRRPALIWLAWYAGGLLVAGWTSGPLLVWAQGVHWYAPAPTMARPGWDPTAWWAGIETWAGAAVAELVARSGIGQVHGAGAGETAVFVWSAAAAALAGWGLWLRRVSPEGSRRTAWAQHGTRAALFCLGVASFAARTAELAAWRDAVPYGRRVTLVGSVSGRPTLSGDYVRVPLRVEQLEGHAVPARTLVLAFLPATARFDPSLAAGDRILAVTSLERPPPAGNPGEFDYAAYLARQGVVATAFLDSPDWTRLAVGNGFAARAARLTAGWTAWVAFRRGETAAALLAGLLWGERGSLAPSAEEAIRRAGLAHLLSVSGLHVSLVAALAWWPVRRIWPDAPRDRRTVRKWLRSFGWLGGLLLAWGYVGLSGARPPALRAGIAATLLAAAQLSGAAYDRLNGLAVAALCLLAFRPLWLFDAGFQLSFAATGAILLGVRAIPTRSGAGLAARVGQVATASIVLSTAAQIGLAPFLAAHFGELAPWGPLINLVAVPLATLALFCGLISFTAWSAAPSLGAWPADGAAALVQLLLSIAERAAALPWAAVYVAPFPLWLIGVWGVLIYAWDARFTGSLPGRRSWALTAALLTCLAWGGGEAMFRLLAQAGVPPWPGLRVLFVDVGQGDAALLLGPTGRAALIDGGGRPEYQRPDSDPNSPDGVGERRLEPLLRRLGVGRLEFVLASHAHADHVQGLLAVLRRGRGAAGWSGGRPAALALYPAGSRGPALTAFLALARERGVPVHALAEGQAIRFDRGVTVDIWHPPGEGTEHWEENDRSVVLAVRYDRVQFLMTGDAERAAQSRLWGKAARPGASVSDGRWTTVFKVPHHGGRSAFFRPFWEGLRPRVAAISVGRNPYGMPAGEVLSGLEGLGAAVWRTDRHGAIDVWTDGAWLRVRAWRPGARAAGGSVR